MRVGSCVLCPFTESVLVHSYTYANGYYGKGVLTDELNLHTVSCSYGRGRYRLAFILENRDAANSDDNAIQIYTYTTSENRDQ